MTNNTLPNDEVSKIAREHAWEWFKFHASQRLIVFNFFLIMTAATVAGFVTTFSSQQYSVSAALALLECIIVVAFFNLDIRNSNLVKLAERYLIDDQHSLSCSLKLPTIEFIRLSEEIKTPHPLNSFRTILRTIFITVGCIAAFSFFISIYYLSKSPAIYGQDTSMIFTIFSIA